MTKGPASPEGHYNHIRISSLTVHRRRYTVYLPLDACWVVRPIDQERASKASTSKANDPRPRAFYLIVGDVAFRVPDEFDIPIVFRTPRRYHTMEFLFSIPNLPDYDFDAKPFYDSE